MNPAPKVWMKQQTIGNWFTAHFKEETKKSSIYYNSKTGT